MTTTCNYLAVDLGTESGRTIVGTLDDDHLTLTETHRFANGPVHYAGAWTEILNFADRGM
jgi:rhamnulokinase